MYHISRKASGCEAQLNFGVMAGENLPQAAFVFRRDNEQTVCGADRKREARVCE